MKKENLDDELKNLPPLLTDLKAKGDGFNVPEGYFDHMEDAVFARLKASGDLGRSTMKVLKRPGLFPLFIRPRTATALAAALALVLAAVWFFRQPDVIEPLPLASTELTEDDIETYVLENLHEFDPAQLAALTPEETTEPAEESTPYTTKKKNSASEELHPDDLEKILDEMTDEELEQIL